MIAERTAILGSEEDDLSPAFASVPQQNIDFVDLLRELKSMKPTSSSPTLGSTLIALRDKWTQSQTGGVNPDEDNYCVCSAIHKPLSLNTKPKTTVITSDAMLVPNRTKLSSTATTQFERSDSCSDTTYSNDSIFTCTDNNQSIVSSVVPSEDEKQPPPEPKFIPSVPEEPIQVLPSRVRLTGENMPFRADSGRPTTSSRATNADRRLIRERHQATVRESEQNVTSQSSQNGITTAAVTTETRDFFNSSSFTGHDHFSSDVDYNEAMRNQHINPMILSYHPPLDTQQVAPSSSSLIEEQMPAVMTRFGSTNNDPPGLTFASSSNSPDHVDGTTGMAEEDLLFLDNYQNVERMVAHVAQFPMSHTFETTHRIGEHRTPSADTMTLFSSASNVKDDTLEPITLDSTLVE